MATDWNLRDAAQESTFWRVVYHLLWVLIRLISTGVAVATLAPIGITTSARVGRWKQRGYLTGKAWGAIINAAFRYIDGRRHVERAWSQYVEDKGGIVPELGAVSIGRWIATIVIAGLLWFHTWGPAAGQTVGFDKHSIHGTTAKLQTTDVKGAVAEVVFRNRNVNDKLDDQRFVLTLGGFAVDVEYTYNYRGRMDAIRVTPPAGYSAVPEVLVVDENEAGTLYIYPNGLGV